MATKSIGSQTLQLVHWATTHSLAETPDTVIQRAKLILLDGVACALFGSHLPWSTTAVHAVRSLEGSDSTCSLIGWSDVCVSPSAAALLNSTFIQAFELDDWHPYAPLHSASLLIPSLMAAVEHLRQQDGTVVSGEQFLTAFVVGLEAGPRIGLGMGGTDLLAKGWHSGAVFGGPAAALAVGRLLGLGEEQMEWALGHACTQAGGLMSAQFESTGKRMQHGFAARNALLAAFLAKANYTGIERVLERSYGGFWGTFSPHNNANTNANSSVPSKPTDHNANPASPFNTLGTSWEINTILIKPYPLMAALHAAVDAARALQDRSPSLLADVQRIQSVTIEFGDGPFKKGGWKLESPTIEPLSAQMNASCAVALQLLDKRMDPDLFAPRMLNRAELRDVIGKVKCVHEVEFDHSLKTRVGVMFEGRERAEELVVLPRGVEPKMSDEEVGQKVGRMLKGVVEEERVQRVTQMIGGLEWMADVGVLVKELGGEARSVLEE